MPLTADADEKQADDVLVAGAHTLGIHLTVGVLAALRAYRDDLVHWSRRMNLTALATPTQIVRQGILDSLACVALLPLGGARVLDIGSGAGFPAIPLALVRPELDFTLVEPSRKKVTFLRHVIRRLRLTHVRIRPNRVEALLAEPEMLGAFDVALARAVAPLAEIGRMVLPFLRPNGIFLAQTGPAERAQHAVNQLVECGLAAIEDRPVPAEFGKPGRRVLALRKAGAGWCGSCFT